MTAATGSGSGLAVGLRATVRAVVGQSDTAIAMGSGDVPVLGTPRLLARAEAASVAAVAPQLADGQTSVGTAVRLEHRRPSPLGADLSVEAELTEIDGRRLVFMFIARAPRGPAAGAGRADDDEDEDEVIGAGTVERVVVDREHFVARLEAGGAARVGDLRVSDDVDQVRDS
jgi:fluoroacetyl-CoA thioesterase